MRLSLLTYIWYIRLFSGTASAQLFNATIDSTTCVAPGDYNTVYDSIVAAEVTCIDLAGFNDDAKLACGCASYVQKINNFASTCWNRIYGCEYQSLVASYFGLCPLAAMPVPYWPSPDNAPGSCSCNTGKVLEAYLAAESQSANCLQNATSIESSGNYNYAGKMDIACSCCATGITISAMYDICPNTNPKLIGLNQIIAAVAGIIPWSSCGASLQQFNCVNDLQFEAPLSTGSVYNPTDLPASGTQTLSNIAGEVTSPASGAVFTYSAVGSEWTVSALSINGKQVSTTVKSAAGTGAASQGGSGSTTVGGTVATGTGSSVGSSTSTTKSEGAKIKWSLGSLIGIMILGGAMLAL